MSSSYSTPKSVRILKIYENAKFDWADLGSLLHLRASIQKAKVKKEIPVRAKQMTHDQNLKILR